MNSNKPSKQQLAEWSTNPKNWVLGIFYFNKLDKRIFPPKRVKSFGWTINFANLKSIFSLLLIFFWIALFINFMGNISNK
jgi:uncharacterized membrane protein